MTIRRLWVLVSRLPAESSTQAVMTSRPGEGPERTEWTTALHILASIHDQFQTLNYLTGANLAGKKNPVPAPKPIPRPGLAAPASSPPTKGRSRPTGVEEF